jgi:hypothetical protein
MPLIRPFRGVWSGRLLPRGSENEPSRQFVNKAPLLQYAEVQKVQSRRGTMFSQTNKPQRPVGLLSDSILRPLFAAYSLIFPVLSVLLAVLALWLPLPLPWLDPRLP